MTTTNLLSMLPCAVIENILGSIDKQFANFVILTIKALYLYLDYELICFVFFLGCPWTWL